MRLILLFNFFNYLTTSEIPAYLTTRKTKNAVIKKSIKVDSTSP